VHLQQEIEAEGLVAAEAHRVDYEVATGLVTLTGAAEVDHPQYHISGEVLRYDMNVQHFQGSGGEEDGRIEIRMKPEMISGDETTPETPPGPPDSAAQAESDGPG
jgi:lipopolysaccharide export system protein LptA